MQDTVTNFFNTLANTKGTNAKMDFVRQSLSDKTVAKLLEMTFNPYVSFNVVKVPKQRKQNFLDHKTHGIILSGLLQFVQTEKKQEMPPLN